MELTLSDTEEEKRRLEEEAQQVKELLKKEVARNDSEAIKNSSIIVDYKNICSQLSLRIDKEQTNYQRKLNQYKKKVSDCDQCRGMLSPVVAPEDPEEGTSGMST